MPLVTIVTPVLGDKNAARTLLAQIPSTLDVEIIVVDGGADPELESVVAAPAGTIGMTRLIGDDVKGLSRVKTTVYRLVASTA